MYVPPAPPLPSLSCEACVHILITRTQPRIGAHIPATNAGAREGAIVAETCQWSR